MPVAPVRSGWPKFQKCRFDHVLAGSSHLSGDVAHGLIGAFDARAVGENDEPGHTCINGVERRETLLGLREVGCADSR